MKMLRTVGVAVFWALLIRHQLLIGLRLLLEALFSAGLGSTMWTYEVYLHDGCIISFGISVGRKARSCRMVNSRVHPAAGGAGSLSYR